MPSPVPAPTATNWGYYDIGHGPEPPSVTWEYRVWVYWSNGETTSKIVNIPRPEADRDIPDFKSRIYDTIDSLIREGTTFRHPDAELPTDPKLPERSGPLSYGRPEPPPPDPDDPVSREGAGTADGGTGDSDPTRWFRP